MKLRTTRLLFLCVANSARSQIGEGLARAIFASTPELPAIVQSAGSKPSGSVHPGAIETLQEIGIEISSQRSKSIDDLDADFIETLDLVITLCAEEICPHLPSKARRLHWPLPDPASATTGNSAVAFRLVREELLIRVNELKAELVSRN